MKERFIKNKNAYKIAQLGLLFALTIVFSFIENMIPAIPSLPPGIKLGLSNTILMYSLFFIDKKSTLTLALLKSFFVFLTKGITAFLMSFFGGVVSIIVMILMFRLKKVKLSYIIISVCAAIAHNITQLTVSALLLSNMFVFYYTPILIVSGIVMGGVTGIVLKVMIPSMRKLGFS